MKPEVSGLEVTKWLKEDPELQAIPVVAVTAFAMKGSRPQAASRFDHLVSMNLDTEIGFDK